MTLSKTVIKVRKLSVTIDEFTDMAIGIELMEIKIEKGYALQDILTDVTKYVIRIKMADETCIPLLRRLADIEYRLASGCSEKLQMSAMIAACKFAAEEMIEQQQQAQATATTTTTTTSSS